MPRPILAVVVGTLAALAFALASHSASFDCAKAATKVEKAICADPGLSRADSDMAAAWRAALAVTPTPASLRSEQREWLKEVSLEPTDLKPVYDTRIATLKDVATAGREARRPVAIATLASRCVPVRSSPSCKVTESGKISLGVGAPWLWQHQSMSDGDLTTGEAMVVLRPAADGRTATAVVWTADDTAFYGSPDLVRSPSGPLLEIQGHLQGTGDLNAGAVFRVASGGLAEIDSTSWIAAMDKRLPAGLEVWKGVYIDFKTLKAATPLWRPNDGNCCGTGGRADLTVKIVGDTVVLDQLRVTRGVKAASSF